MPSFCLSHGYALFINRQLLYCSTTKAVPKIYLANLND